MNFDEYLSNFPTFDAAVEFETQCLSCGYLPACAQAVLRDEPSTPEYWAWLADQIQEN